MPTESGLQQRWRRGCAGGAGPQWWPPGRKPHGAGGTMPQPPTRDAPPEVLDAYLRERRRRWPRLDAETSEAAARNSTEAASTSSSVTPRERAGPASSIGQPSSSRDVLPGNEACFERNRPGSAAAQSNISESVASAVVFREKPPQCRRRFAETRPTARFRALLESDAKAEEQQEVILDCLETIARLQGWIE
jgi:hypothetical protein